MAKINSTYDVGAAFEAIENELMKSMIRNMKRHKVEEVAEDMEWTMWQTEQLHALEKYRKENQKKFGKQFQNINAQIETLLQIANADGQMSQEAAILRAIKNGFPARRVGRGATAEFFRLNERKLNALIGATMKDMQRAEVAVLRMANDQYRKVIFNAQMYANTGAATYEKAVDMATKDFAAAGLNCIQYSNGARHTLPDYADMAIRTAAKRAYLQGEGTKRQEWGIHTVIVNKRSDRGPGGVCPKCLPFVGKVFIDDVWSGGKRSDGPYPLISTAIEAGLYHPRCKDSHTTYFPGISAPPDDSFTKKDLKEIEEAEKESVKQQNAQLQAEKWQRVADTRLDPENRQAAQQKADEWKPGYQKTGKHTSAEYAEQKRLQEELRKRADSFKAPDTETARELLLEQAEDWVKLLTSSEERSITKYALNLGDKKGAEFFRRLNEGLSKRGIMTSSLERHAKNISSGLKKFKLEHNILCFRGVDVDPTQGLEIGGLLFPKHFFSTSISRKRAFTKKYCLEIQVPKGSTGAYIETLSPYGDKQQEFLLDKDCVYRLLSRKGNRIILEVS